MIYRAGISSPFSFLSYLKNHPEFVQMTLYTSIPMQNRSRRLYPDIFLSEIQSFNKKTPPEISGSQNSEICELCGYFKLIHEARFLSGLWSGAVLIMKRRIPLSQSHITVIVDSSGPLLF